MRPAGTPQECLHVITAAVRLPVHHARQETPVALRLLNAISPPLATATV